jgi:hypothetical protein
MPTRYVSTSTSPTHNPVLYPKLIPLQSSQALSVEVLSMSLYEQIVYRTICDNYSYSRNYVSTAIIAGQLAKNDRVIRRTLVKMEASGHIKRRGKRGGWMPATSLRLRDPFLALSAALAYARAA